MKIIQTILKKSIWYIYSKCSQIEFFDKRCGLLVVNKERNQKPQLMTILSITTIMLMSILVNEVSATTTIQRALDGSYTEVPNTTSKANNGVVTGFTIIEPEETMERVSNHISFSGNITSGNSFSGAANASWQFVGDPLPLPNTAVNDIELKTAADGSLYLFENLGNFIPVALRFNGSIWENMVNIPSITGVYFSLAINPDPLNIFPYLAYADISNGWKGSAIKFNPSNNSWGLVGNNLFSDGKAEFISLAINPVNGVLYAGFVDGSRENKATVMKLDPVSNLWVSVGDPGFSAGATYYSSLAISNDGIIYAAFQDRAYANKVSVMTFDDASNSWVCVGGSCGISNGASQNTSLAVDSNGQVFLGFVDGSVSNRATVMKFDGTSWSYVGGTPGFSSGEALITTVALDPRDNALYIGYSDVTNNHAATAMKFNGVSWDCVGPCGFSAGWVVFPTLIVDANGIPYVSFKDNDDKLGKVMKFD